MMILGHLGTEQHVRREPYFTGGLLYPDVFVVTTRIQYAATHLLGVTNTRAMQLTAHIQGAQVAQFAAGLVKHLRDDRRSPLIAQYGKAWALPICRQVRETLTLGALAHHRTLVERTVLLEVIEAVIEFALAQRTRMNPLLLVPFDSIFSDLAVVRFIAQLWSLDMATVRQVGVPWATALLKLSQYTVEDLVWFEMRTVWPKLVAAHLQHVGLLTPRESILARRQIEAELDRLLLSMHEIGDWISHWFPLGSLLQQPQPAAPSVVRLIRTAN